jgi:hypothetical protein
MTLGQCSQPLVRDEADQASRYGDNVMVEPLQREPMEVDEIARELEFRELTLPAAKILGARHPTFDQKRRIADLTPGVNEGLMCGNLDCVGDEASNDFDFLGTDLVSGTKLQKVLFN